KHKLDEIREKHHITVETVNKRTKPTPRLISFDNMLDIFRSLFTFWRRRAVYIDGLLFRIHTRLTVALLLLFCVIVISRQYIWSPIVCYGEELPRDILNAYCWTHSTFTVPSTKNHVEELAPGVGLSNSDGGIIRTHRYYQWVGLCLFFQAVLFYVPKWLWSVWEGGKIHRLKNNLCPGFTSDEEKLKRSESVLEYLISNLGRHETWSRKYFVCEVLTLVNVIGQGFLMNRFLGGVFWSYGHEVFNFMEMDSENRVDPMIRVFPEITKCTFRKYGTSGVVQKHDAMCVLPLNLLNQKIYVFLWFWTVFLMTLTSCLLIVILFLHCNAHLRWMFMRVFNKNMRLNVLDTVVMRTRTGDWFLLYLLSKNVDPEVFRELMHQFAQKIGDRESEKIEFNAAVLFYTPKWLWSVWEGGKIRHLKNTLSSGFSSKEEILEKNEKALDYLISNLSIHETWSKKYFICEILTLVNVVGQGFLMNKFLGGVFWEYGSDILILMETDSENRVDPMIKTFPEVTSCIYKTPGPSGAIQKYDVMCVLPLNILNQQIYAFLWFWSVLLMVLTTVVLLLRIVAYWNVSMRLYIMRMSTENICKNVLTSVVNRIRPGDWFLLYLLNKNIDPEVFRELMQELAKRSVQRETEEIQICLDDSNPTSGSENVTRLKSAKRVDYQQLPSVLTSRHRHKLLKIISSDPVVALRPVGTQSLRHCLWDIYCVVSKRKKMLDVFKAVVTFFHRRHVQRDCLLFRLHHSVTTAILLVFCLVVGIHQFVRSPIICNTSMVPRDILDQYCWTHSTYSVVSAFKKKVGSEVPYLGVDITRKDAPVKTLKYYQWVFLCLLFQAILFFLPGWLWNSWEGGKLRKLRMDLDVGFITEADKNEKKKRLLEYLEQNRHNHNIWAYKYFFCEFLALVNVFGQMFLMNRFLDGEFLSFGVRVLQFMESDEEDRVDPMIYVFPRVTKCTFHRYSPSGTIEIHDSICVLPLNIINEKIYVFLWFWCLGLLIATLGLMLYRSFLFVSPKLRHLVFNSRYRTIRRDVTDLLARQSEFGDWFLYYMLGENMDNIIFRDVMQEHAHRLRYCIRSSRTELTDCL
ncbi:hypothetical protein C0J52_20550, partial [Blattella germanica]